MKQWGLIVALLCAVVILISPVGALSPIPWCAQQDLFFFNQSSADIAGYRVLQNYPELSNERVLKSPGVTAASGEKTIATFIVPEGEFYKDNSIQPGLWRFRGYFNASSAVGDTTVKYYLINRTSTGTETVLFYGNAITQDINTLDMSEYLTSYARRNATALFPGDRLAIRVNVSTTSTAARNVHMAVAGNLHASMVSMAYFHCTDEDILPSGAGSAASAPIPPIVIVGALFVAVVAWVKKE
jgi:hypothetical protein